MSNASDSLDLIAAADRAVKAAEVGEVEAGNALRLAKLAVKHAKQKLAETIAAVLDEKRQPRLPFDEAVSQAVTRIAATDPEPEPPQVTATSVPEPEPVAKSWRDMTLEAAGFMAGDDAFEEEVCAALVAADVRTCGQLAERLLAGELFGLEARDLEPVYAAVEMLSEDDEAPIDFDAHFNPEPKGIAAFRGEYIGGLGLTLDEIERSYMGDAFTKKLKDPPLKVAPFPLDSRLYVNAGGCSQYMHHSFDCLELFTPKEFAELHPGRELRNEPRYWDGMPDVERHNADWGVRVRNGKSEYVLGRRDQGRTLTTKNPDGPFDPAAFNQRKEADAVNGLRKPTPEAVKKPAASGKQLAEPGKSKVKVTKVCLDSGPATIVAHADNPMPDALAGSAPSFEVGTKPFPAAPRVTLLAEVDNFPDAVWDALFPLGVSSLETLLERVEAECALLGDLPLHNKLVTYFVKVGVKINPASKAAAAVADHVGKSGRAAAVVVGAGEASAITLNTPLIDLLTGADVSKAGRALEAWHPGVPTVETLLGRCGTAAIGASYTSKLFSYLRDIPDLGSTAAHQIGDALVDTGFVTFDGPVRHPVKVVDVLNLPKPKATKKSKGGKGGAK
jgi:hypothetical protein